MKNVTVHTLRVTAAWLTPGAEGAQDPLPDLNWTILVVGRGSVAPHGRSMAARKTVIANGRLIFV